MNDKPFAIEFAQKLNLYSNSNMFNITCYNRKSKLNSINDK